MSCTGSMDLTSASIVTFGAIMVTYSAASGVTVASASTEAALEDQQPTTAKEAGFESTTSIGFASCSN